jgi:hypothetical protein
LEIASEALGLLLETIDQQAWREAKGSSRQHICWQQRQFEPFLESATASAPAMPVSARGATPATAAPPAYCGAAIKCMVDRP